ncbi:hypothetical protein FEF26_15190 [Nesterenkonia salmonea]|uniref:Uncharacterized protein n=1 Tax=Nesterenkonia salmonea TaxID=1804987 RepID=A0A5R9B524_9MICC|nr:hypothetical protein [Nesterenkonia salmonea]TLP90684.1 hypothetical protein FEF26_15190 [Nesterenkonia salmonea]
MEPVAPGRRVLRYGDDTSETVIAQVIQGLSIRKTAEQVGVPQSTDHRWVTRARAGQSRGSNGRPRHPGREQFHRLRQKGRFVRETTPQWGSRR